MRSTLCLLLFGHLVAPCSKIRLDLLSFTFCFLKFRTGNVFVATIIFFSFSIVNRCTEGKYEFTLCRMTLSKFTLRSQSCKERSQI